MVIEAEQCLPLETGMDWDQAQGIFHMVEMFCIVTWVVNIQVYRYVKFTKPYVTIFVLYFKKEKKKTFLTGKNILQSLEPELTVSDLRLDTFLLRDLRQVT